MINELNGYPFAGKLEIRTQNIKPMTSGLLQRACACGQHSGNGVKCESCKKKHPGLQQSAIEHDSLDVAPPIVHEVLRSLGRPLDKNTLTFMKARFGQDFSHVRVHSDARAAASAQAVNARAYTVGSNLVFGAGQYAPDRPQGQQLLAHELTHVIQQSRMALSASAPLTIGPANDALEREAATAASTQATGSAGNSLQINSTPMLQRQTGDAPVHTGSGGTNRALLENVPSEKWSEMIEQQYRRRGDTFRADAVRTCRIAGGAACARLLTPADVDRLHQLARQSGGNREQIQAGVAALGLVPGLTPLRPPGLPPGFFPSPGAPPVRIPPVRLPPVTFPTPPVTTPVPPISPGPAAGAGVGAGVTAAGVTAIVAICVIAGFQLWELGRFQQELRNQGFVILEEALGLCIGGCHLPSRPTPSFREFPSFPETEPFPFPDVELEPERRRRRRRGCFLREAFPLGGNAEHDALAAHVTGAPVEYILTEPDFPLVARYDGKDAIDTLYEIKTRHDFLHLLDQPGRRLGPGGRRAISEGVPGIIAQLENQALVASVCGYEFRVATNNLGVVDILRELAPGIPVEYVEFPWP